jgi:TonB family protein
MRNPILFTIALICAAAPLATAQEEAGAADVKAILAEANSALQAKNYNKAYELASKVADANPKQAGARFIAGAAALNLRQVEAADRYLREAWELKPDMPWLALWMGQLAMLEGDGAVREGKDDKALQYYNEAVGYFDTEAKNRPGNPGPLANKAQALSKANRLPESIATYEELIKLNPDVPDNYLSAAEVYIQGGQTEKAIEMVKRVPTTDKAAAARAITKWGDSLFQQGLMDVVVPVMEYAHQLDPVYTLPCGKLVAAYLQLGHPPEAWARLTEFLSHNPPAEEQVAVGDAALSFLRRRGNPLEALPADEDGIVLPWLDNLARPKVPAAARQARVDAAVPLLVQVGADGKIVNATVIPTSSSASNESLGLDAAAIDTVNRSRFKPGKKNGKAEALPVGVMIEFKPS